MSPGGGSWGCIALHLLIASIVALQDAKDGCGEGFYRSERGLRHSGVRRKDQYGTGDFCDLRNCSRDGGLAMSFI